MVVMDRMIMRKRILCILCGLMSLASICYVGTCFDLTPGVPIKKDAASILGKPVTEKMPGMRYEYAPKEDAHDRILVTFERNAGIIKTINPYFKQKQTK